MLVFILMTLGWMFLSASLHSKNVSFTFFQDELIRLVAESALAESRSRLIGKMRGDPGVKEFLRTFGTENGPREGKFPVLFANASLPATEAIRKELFGAIPVEFQVEPSLFDVVRDIRFTDYDGKWVERRAAGEFQGTVKFDVVIRTFLPAKTKVSRFVFEYDLKQTCLRKGQGTGPETGYPTTDSNDYSLIVRDSRREAVDSLAANLNNVQNTLFVLEPPGTARPAKILLGHSEPREFSTPVFLNISERYSALMPPSPSGPVLTLSWQEMKQYLPGLTSQIEATVRDGMPDEAKDKWQQVVNSFVSHFSVVYHPIVSDPATGWVRDAPQDEKTTYIGFFNRFTNSPRLPERHLGNSGPPISIYGDKDFDPNLILQGNVRQRFWQTVRWVMTSNEPRFRAQLEKDTLRVVECLLPEDRVKLPPPGREFYDMVNALEAKTGFYLSSRPNDKFTMTKNPPLADQGFPLPTFHDEKRAKLEGWHPFDCYPLRSYKFPDQDTFKSSPLWDKDRKILHLLGDVQVRVGMELPPGTRYRGQGVLLVTGPVILGGSFEPEAPADGPCILSTNNGVMSVNKNEQGRIEASLMALSFGFPEKFFAVDFNGKPLDLKGNLIVDRLNLMTLQKGFSNSSAGSNRIVYDAERLDGKTAGRLDFSYLGGRLRRMATVYESGS